MGKKMGERRKKKRQRVPGTKLATLGMTTDSPGPSLALSPYFFSG